MPGPAEPFATELDARNRATNYLHQAMEDRERQGRDEQSRQSTDFQQMLWIKNLDHSHALEARNSEHRHAMEMEEKRQRAAFEIRQLEQLNAPKAGGVQGPSTGSWMTKTLLAVCAIVLPLVIPLLFQTVLRKTSRMKRVRRFPRKMKRRKPFRKQRRRKSWTS